MVFMTQQSPSQTRASRPLLVSRKLVVLCYVSVLIISLLFSHKPNHPSQRNWPHWFCQIHIRNPHDPMLLMRDRILHQQNVLQFLLTISTNKKKIIEYKSQKSQVMLTL